MQTSEHLTALRRDGGRLAEIARAADLDARVPSCPEWSLAELLRHLGDVHRWYAAIAAHGASDTRPDVETEGDEGDGDLVKWYETGLEEALDTFEDLDPGAPCWTWWDGGQVRGVVRRVAQETQIHRWDAEAAVGEPPELDATMAVDGIAEFVDLFLPRTEARRPWPHEHATLHLHRSDGRGNWAVTLDAGDGERRWARDDAAVVRGTASDLLLVLWRRKPLDAVTVTGDRELVAHFVAYADL